MWQVEFYIGDEIIDVKEYTSEEDAIAAGEYHNMRNDDDSADEDLQPSFSHTKIDDTIPVDND